MELTAKHREYWHKNCSSPQYCCFIWFLVTFVEGWYARELNAYTFWASRSASTCPRRVRCSCMSR
jgi:uncharacterized membrane protein